ncbi:MAG: MotA/TolQ/ExbB proton channel family protein, partial [Chitinispirillia bacterium]
MNIIDELIRAFYPSQDGFFFMWILASLAVFALILIMERWFDIQRRTNVDAEGFTENIIKLIRENKNDEAYSVCCAAGKRALPRIFGAGIKNINESSEIILGAMEEESLHLIPVLEKRINYILMFGNISTLLGLMGTIYGLILSFAAVARPDVNPVEKSSLLAAGISTAMNTTLFGLIISVPCIFLFSILRSKIDGAIYNIDRYSTSILRVLLPAESVSKNYRVSGKRVKEEVDTEPNIAPMMNLMVILIPL